MEHHLQMFLLVELLQCHQIMVHLLWDKIMESLLRDKLTQLLQWEHLMELLLWEHRMELLLLTVNLMSINMDSLSTADQFTHLHHHKIPITLPHLIHNTHLLLLPNNQ